MTTNKKLFIALGISAVAAQVPALSMPAALVFGFALLTLTVRYFFFSLKDGTKLVGEGVEWINKKNLKEFNELKAKKERLGVLSNEEYKRFKALAGVIK